MPANPMCLIGTVSFQLNSVAAAVGVRLVAGAVMEMALGAVPAVTATLGTPVSVAGVVPSCSGKPSPPAALVPGVSWEETTFTTVESVAVAVSALTPALRLSANPINSESKDEMGEA